jgi:hypothetical protein
MYDPPAYLWVLTLAGEIGILSTTCIVLYRGGAGAGLGRRRAALLACGAAVMFGGWLAASAEIAAAGSYHAQLGKGIPWFAIAPPAFFLVLLAMSRIPMVSRALSGPGMTSRVLLPHSFRVAGLAFVIMMALGQLPAVFALPAGLGDFAVGIAAPGVARRLAAGGDRRGGMWFNALGITDLVVALTLGGLTGFRIIHVTPVNNAITALPLAMIPTVAVPLLLVLHIVSLRQLRGGSAAQETGTPSVRKTVPSA